ncbi:hypothetical protein SAMN04489844_4027 [Nocardioides exalbidus]|uniref:Uncharacterized protein n=1 Tax=Nocardioides exalbidus TaxID=402596 RepID=A0A1H4Z7I8_9ACTN|nr:hypothetical protein [Nocardioides exalbidus]SED25568.1 hypothetical protein SAMN04489844_4027 [Nocardioides exalbidus]
MIAVGWVALGFSAIEDGDMWRGAVTVGLGALWGSMYLWPESAVSRFAQKPIFRRRKTEKLSGPGRG